VTYFKTALGMVILREQILGPERFDPAFRRFIAAWAFKHPAPADFFRAMESEGGEDLSWFWRGWFYNNWQLDLAVTGIKPFPADAPFKGALVTVESLDKMVLPITGRNVDSTGINQRAGGIQLAGRPGRARPRSSNSRQGPRQQRFRGALTRLLGFRSGSSSFARALHSAGRTGSGQATGCWEEIPNRRPLLPTPGSGPRTPGRHRRAAHRSSRR
jgi:hypothetical protein